MASTPQAVALAAVDASTLQDPVPRMRDGSPAPVDVLELVRQATVADVVAAMGTVAAEMIGGTR